MQTLVNLVPLIIVFVLFYFMVFAPEKKRKKQYDEMLSTIKVNDEVMSKGGIMGRVVNVQDDYIILESGPDRARIKLSKNGIGHIIVSENKEAI